MSILDDEMKRKERALRNPMTLAKFRKAINEDLHPAFAAMHEKLTDEQVNEVYRSACACWHRGFSERIEDAVMSAIEYVYCDKLHPEIAAKRDGRTNGAG